jgi:hypothetical protein
LLLWALALPLARAQGNLLVNGSFEQPNAIGTPLGQLAIPPPSMPGWQIGQALVAVTSPQFAQPAPGQGSQALHLGGSDLFIFRQGAVFSPPGSGGGVGSSIGQQIPTEVGRDYAFSGWLSSIPIVSQSRANVFINDTFLTQLVHSGSTTTGDLRWQFFAHRFRATGPATRLTISDVTGVTMFQNFAGNIGGTLLDGLSVTLAAAQDDLTSSPARLFVSAVDGTPTRLDQVEIAVGQCVTLTFVLRTSSGGLVDVSQEANTTFFTNPSRGTFTARNVWCPTEADRDRFVTIYARYFHAATQQTITDSVIIKVKR